MKILWKMALLREKRYIFSSVLRASSSRARSMGSSVEGKGSSVGGGETGGLRGGEDRRGDVKGVKKTSGEDWGV
jgi:hypothetical protein